MIAISHHVAERIRRHYGRDAAVIYPPVELDRFTPASGPRDYYLLAGAMAPYKRGDLAIEACRRMGRRLVVAGTGPEEPRLRRLAGPDVEFRSGWIDDRDMAALYAGARGLLFPGEEDFGIVPVEAMASGCPVAAFGVGGAVETIGRGAPSASARRGRRRRRRARAGRRAVRPADRVIAVSGDRAARGGARGAGGRGGMRASVRRPAVRRRVPRRIRSAGERAERARRGQRGGCAALPRVISCRCRCVNSCSTAR
jgi:glycosyltransferase involved in cell wall biosynthesis